jgi:hypothetical protein
MTAFMKDRKVIRPHFIVLIKFRVRDLHSLRLKVVFCSLQIILYFIIRMRYKLYTAQEYSARIIFIFLFIII